MRDMQVLSMEKYRILLQVGFIVPPAYINLNDDFWDCVSLKCILFVNFV